MRVSDYRIFEFDVSFTQTIQHHEPVYGEKSHQTVHPNTLQTRRVLAPKYSPTLAEAMMREWYQFQNPESVKILAVREVEIHGIVERHV